MYFIYLATQKNKLHNQFEEDEDAVKEITRFMSLARPNYYRASVPKLRSQFKVLTNSLIRSLNGMQTLSAKL